jgi:hypothetical protein
MISTSVGTQSNSHAIAKITHLGDVELITGWHHAEGAKAIPLALSGRKEDRAYMRTMVKFTIPTQESNPLIRDGSIAQTLETILGKLQPKAAYFCPIDGKRGGFIVINLEDESEIVTKLEPLWLEAAATVETFPVATADDLRAGLQNL